MVIRKSTFSSLKCLRHEQKQFSLKYIGFKAIIWLSKITKKVSCLNPKQQRLNLTELSMRVQENEFRTLFIVFLAISLFSDHKMNSLKHQVSNKNMVHTPSFKSHFICGASSSCWSFWTAQPPRFASNGQELESKHHSSELRVRELFSRGWTLKLFGMVVDFFCHPRKQQFHVFFFFFFPDVSCLQIYSCFIVVSCCFCFWMGLLKTPKFLMCWQEGPVCDSHGADDRHLRS